MPEPHCNFDSLPWERGPLNDSSFRALCKFAARAIDDLSLREVLDEISMRIHGAGDRAQPRKLIDQTRDAFTFVARQRASEILFGRESGEARAQAVSKWPQPEPALINEISAKFSRATLFALSASSPSDVSAASEVLPLLFPAESFICSAPEKDQHYIFTLEETCPRAIHAQYIVPNPAAGKARFVGRLGHVSSKFLENFPERRFIVVEFDFVTLSTLLRDAWDKGDFQILNKNTPMKATGAHFSIVGHTTDEDLQMTLDDCDLHNGFANRTLWTAPRRAQFLPHGGNVDRAKFAVLAASLKSIIFAAKGIGEMRRDDETTEQWDDVYHVLSAERAGLLGAVTNRAEAQVLRLSMIYALADGSRVIKLVHQKAALAAWDYCFRSAQRIFGSRLANHDAQKILEELRRRPEGMTRKQILDEVFFRNGSRADHDRAFEMLLKSELAHRKTEPTGGRNAERWFAT